MPDKIDIEIKATGGDAAASEIDKVTAAEEAASQGAGNLTGTLQKVIGAFTAAAAVARYLWTEYRSGQDAAANLVEKLRTLGVAQDDGEKAAAKLRDRTRELTEWQRQVKIAIEESEDSSKRLADGYDASAEAADRLRSAQADLEKAQIEADVANGRITDAEGIRRLASIDAEQATAKQQAAEQAAAREITAARAEMAKLESLLAEARGALDAAPDSSRDLRNAQGRLDRSQGALGQIGYAASFAENAGFIATGDQATKDDLIRYLGGPEAAREIMRGALHRGEGATESTINATVRGAIGLGADPLEFVHDRHFRKEIIAELDARADIEAERSEKAREDIKAAEELLQRERSAREAIVRDLENRAREAAANEAKATAAGQGVLDNRAVVDVQQQAADLRAQTRAAQAEQQAAEQQRRANEAAAGSGEGFAIRGEAALQTLRGAARQKGVGFNSDAQLVKELIAATEALRDGATPEETARAAEAARALADTVPAVLGAQRREIQKLAISLEELRSQFANRSYE